MEIYNESPTSSAPSSQPRSSSKTRTWIAGISLLLVVAAGVLVLVVSDTNKGGIPSGPSWWSAVVSSSLDASSSIISSSSSSSSSNTNAPHGRALSGGPRIQVLYAAPRAGEDGATATATASTMMRKWNQEFQQHLLLVDPLPLDVHDTPAFLKACPGAVTRVEAFVEAEQPHLALEVLKWCALSRTGSGLVVDASNNSVLVDTLDHILEGIGGGNGKGNGNGSGSNTNVAVLNDGLLPSSIHGALFYFSVTHAKSNQKLAASMLQILITTKVEHLMANPTLLPKSLYDLVTTDAGVGKLVAGAVRTSSSSTSSRWYLLEHSCTIEPLGRRQATSPISTYALQSYRLTQNCPEPNGFCCSIFDPIEHTPIMMTKHLMLPYQILPDANHLPKPLNAEAGHYEEDDLPYISTMAETIHTTEGDTTPRLTPNLFEILLQNDCLPSDKKCSDCLKNKAGANCQKCAGACACYCKALCHIPVEEKLITKSLVVRPPLFARDPSRLVPRIIHQTWFEDVTHDKYPNMSRLIESFKQSGWDYKFYTDDESANFLSTHFPPEVRQAYDALRPGAFKADLFRYCVLLIHGGVYADMDIMLEANLDLAVANDVGFMVPQDEPGTPVNHRMCLWNGFIAAAPGHPFLAKVIQTVVNNVRNRFTGVDLDHLFCPDPELSLLHSYDTLFTAGPCILGAMVNKVLGRHGQTSFEAGEIDIWEASKKAAVERGTDFVIGIDDRPSARIPGKTIILHQNKLDMGAHRFTLLDKNLVVAATDLPDADDRANQEKPAEHYSKTHVKAGIYGLDKLYTDNVKANEELRFYIDAQWRLSISVEPSTVTATA